MFARKKESVVELAVDVRQLLDNRLGKAKSISDIGSILREFDQNHGAQAYSFFFQKVLHLDLSPGEARKHWMEIEAHHRAFESEIGESIDFRVSSLDYFLRIAKRLKNPAILESKLLQKFQQDSMTDELTGLYNHRHFIQALDKEMDRATRYRERLGLLFFDIDRFKQLNDRKGHLSGDEVLRLVGNILADSVRSSDSPCRFGGEEFVVITPQIQRQGAIFLAERIRKSVEVKTEVTLSGGIACFPEDARTAKELIEKADQAMYRAKERGRNQIQVSQDERRREERVPLELDGFYSIVATRNENLSTRNVSRDGFLIKTSQPLAPDSKVAFQLSLSPEEAIKCVGRVAFVRDVQDSKTFEVGVSIVDMSSEDEGKFIGFITGKKK